jgi:hypothetical protein
MYVCSIRQRFEMRAVFVRIWFRISLTNKNSILMQLTSWKTCSFSRQFRHDYHHRSCSTNSLISFSIVYEICECSHFVIAVCFVFSLVNELYRIIWIFYWALHFLKCRTIKMHYRSCVHIWTCLYCQSNLIIMIKKSKAWLTIETIFSRMKYRCHTDCINLL